MKRVATGALALLLAVPAAAELSVSRLPDGSIELFFEPGPTGPWQLVRPGLPVGDLLNADGDLQGDSWPQILTHPETGRPDVAWSTGGENREIHFSWHDGELWRAPVNLSSAAGNDELPAMQADAHGNRFVAWTRSRNGRDLVLLTALAGDDAAQTSVFELSERHDSARRPALNVHGDGDVFVAYEEGHGGNDPVIYLALDHVVPQRGSGGYLSDSGERPIDIARSSTFATGASSDQALKPQVHSEHGSLWVDWLDDAGTLAWVEWVDGAFTSPVQVSLDEAGGEAAARAQVREDVLGL